MAKPYPTFVALKNPKCPQCGSRDFNNPDLKPAENAVQIACRTEKCDYAFELFWLGDNEYWKN